MAVWNFCEHRKIWGAGNSKRYSSCSFHQISSKIYDDIGCYRRIPAITCHVWFFEFILGSFGAFWKISGIIFKRVLFNSFHPISTIFDGKYGNQVDIQTVIFLAVYQILKIYGTCHRCHLCYIAIIHKTLLVSSGKRSSRESRPLGLFIYLFFFALLPFFSWFSFRSCFYPPLSQFQSLFSRANYGNTV